MGEKVGGRGEGAGGVRRVCKGLYVIFAAKTKDLSFAFVRQM